MPKPFKIKVLSAYVFYVTIVICVHSCSHFKMVSLAKIRVIELMLSCIEEKIASGMLISLFNEIKWPELCRYLVTIER